MLLLITKNREPNAKFWQTHGFDENRMICGVNLGYVVSLIKLVFSLNFKTSLDY